MNARTKRIAAGLMTGVVLAAMGPILAAVGPLSGNIGSLSGNLGLVSGNVGLRSGNVGLESGNLGLLSGNLSEFASLAATRGALGYMVDFPKSGGFRVFWFEGRKDVRASESASIAKARYGWNRGQGVYGFYYECNVLQHGCAFFQLNGSTADLKIGPLLRKATFDGEMRNVHTGALCRVRVEIEGDELRTGHFLGGDITKFGVTEEAAAAAYRYATSTATGSCFAPFVQGKYAFAFTYMNVWVRAGAHHTLLKRR